MQMSPGAHIPLDDAVSTDVSKAGMDPGMGFSPEMAAAKMSKLKRGEGQVRSVAESINKAMFSRLRPSTNRRSKISYRI